MGAFKISLGPFQEGLSNAVDPALLGTRPQDLYNVKMSRGVLEGLPGIGEEVASTSLLNPVAAHYAAGTRWVFDSTEAWYLDDSDVTYRTRLGQSPQILTPTQDLPLGITPPASFQWAGTAGAVPAGDHDYVFVFRTGTGLRSNPSVRLRITLSGGGKITFYGISTTDPRVTAIEAYKTKDGAADGLLFFLKEISGNALGSSSSASVVLVDDGSVAVDSARPLTWDYGGSRFSQALPEDHAPAPILTHLSDVPHSASGGSQSGSRILFGGLGSQARWCRKGIPDYWPVVNSEDLPGGIEAIKTITAQTAYFLQEGIWVANGTDDRNISWTQAANMGIREGGGRATIKTPFGIIFPAQEGLAVWRYSGNAEVISRPIFNPTFWTALDIRTGAYFEQAYWLFCSDRTYLFDLTDWPRLRCVPVRDKAGAANLMIVASHMTDWSEPVTSRPLQPLNVDTAVVSNSTDRRRRHAMAGGSIGGKDKLYVLGGFYFSGAPVNNLTGDIVTSRIAEYDIAGGKWTNMTAMAENRRDLVSTVYGGFLWYQGGVYRNSSNAPVYLSSLVKYDPTASSGAGAISSTISGGPAKFAHSAALADPYWYLFGGATDDTNITGSATDTLHRFYFGNSTWSTLAASGRKRTFSAAAFLNGKFYVFFGMSETGALTTDVQIYDPATNTWSFDDSSASAGAVFNRYRHVAWSDPDRKHDDGRPDGVMYVLGGQGLGADHLSDLWEYAPASGSLAAKWHCHVGSVVNLGERANAAGAVMGNVYYLFGGRNQRSLWNSDLNQIDFASMQDCEKVPGLFLAPTRAQGDSANRVYRALAGGASKWEFQTGDIGEPALSKPKRWRRLCLDSKGRLDIEILRDGASVLTASFRDNQLGTVGVDGSFTPYKVGTFQAGACRLASGQGRVVSVKFKAPLVDANGKLDANGTATGYLRKAEIEAEVVGE